jgi:hypothetical protein
MRADGRASFWDEVWRLGLVATDYIAALQVRNFERLIA